MSSKYTVQVNLYGSLFRCTALSSRDTAIVNYNYGEKKIGLHDKIHVLKIHGSGKVAYSVATLLRFFVYTVRLMSSSYTHVVLVGLLIKLKFCFTSTETVGLLGTGAQDVHLDFYTAPELCLVCSATDLLYSQSVAWTSRLQNAHLWRSVRVASFF